MTLAQPPVTQSWKRLAIFAGLSFIVSCFGWLGLVWLSEFGFPFNRRTSYALIVILCGAIGLVMKMWRREQSVLFNFSTTIVCLAVPAVTLPLLAVGALYFACHGETACDL